MKKMTARVLTAKKKVLYSSREIADEHHADRLGSMNTVSRRKSELHSRRGGHRMKLVEIGELQALRRQPEGRVAYPQADESDTLGLLNQSRAARDSRNDRRTLQRFRQLLRRALAS